MMFCPDCELHYDVTWNNDGQEPPTKFCPRCGCEEVVENSDDCIPAGEGE